MHAEAGRGHMALLQVWDNGTVTVYVGATVTTRQVSANDDVGAYITISKQYMAVQYKGYVPAVQAQCLIAV
jgi:hypothetical protein